jgi:hypothetical protein
MIADRGRVIRRSWIASAPGRYGITCGQVEQRHNQREFVGCCSAARVDELEQSLGKVRGRG